METTIYADRELTMTMQEFIGANAFYPSSRRQIKKQFAGREALSALDVLELEIPNNEKLRAVLRKELIPARILHMLAVEFARAALMREREAGREPDERSWRALDVKLAWLDGAASDEELEAAKAAAIAAADAAALAAARATARATAWATYWAAQAVANAAATEASDAAYWAAWDAARDATWTKQVAIVKRMLGLAI